MTERLHWRSPQAARTATPRSMFDYDARPVTPLLVLVGGAASRGAYVIRDFLSRNGLPFEWVDAGQPDAVRAVLRRRSWSRPPGGYGRSGWCHEATGVIKVSGCHLVPVISRTRVSRAGESPGSDDDCSPA
jgi:hypothetical protein